jgi:hypothetical protein
METGCDLSAELSVFVLTVGAPSFAACVKRLEAQDCRFQLEVIENVAPMSRALQCMLDRCRTHFFVQVDEDMLLYPHAIRSLYTRLATAPPEVAILTCHLFDTHAQRVIYGLKIYRHAIVRAYPYDNVESSEYDQIRRFTKDGFVDLRLPIEDDFRPSEATLGEHGSFWTARSVFERYLTLERKVRRHSKDAPTTSATWVEAQAAFFLKRYLDTGAELDLYALMGVIAGRLAPLGGRGREKDYRDYARLPGFRSLVRFVEEATAEPDHE